MNERRVPPEFQGGGPQGRDAQKAWLDGFDTAARICPTRIVQNVNGHLVVKSIKRVSHTSDGLVVEIEA